MLRPRPLSLCSFYSTVNRVKLQTAGYQYKAAINYRQPPPPRAAATLTRQLNTYQIVKCVPGTSCVVIALCSVFIILIFCVYHVQATQLLQARKNEEDVGGICEMCDKLRVSQIIKECPSSCQIKRSTFPP